MAIVWLRKERKVGDGMDHGQDYVIEMLHITKEFPGIKATTTLPSSSSGAKSMRCWAKTVPGNPR